MELTKISLNDLAIADLNERELCRLWGRGNPGSCQCGCHYYNSGGSSSPTNDSANFGYGYTSDPGAQPCNCPQSSACTRCGTCPIHWRVCAFSVSCTGQRILSVCDQGGIFVYLNLKPNFRFFFLITKSELDK